MVHESLHKPFIAEALAELQLFKLQAEFIAVLREQALHGSPQQRLARKAGIASGKARRALRKKNKTPGGASPGVLNASTPVGKTDVTI